MVVNKSSWAEESEDNEEDRYVAPERLVLPTAPRTAREPDVDPERIPREPPFTAYIANLPFEVDDEDIIRFFQDLKVKSIRLPREGGEGGRFKGFGYVEFETRNDLADALTKNDDVMGNRKIRVDVAEGEGGNQRRGFSDRGGRDEDRLDRSEGVSDWRAAPRDAPSRDGGRDDRSPGRGGYDRDRRDEGRGGFGDRDRGGYGDRGYGDRDRGGYGDRDRGGFGDRDRDRGGYGDRDRGGYGDRDRGGGFGDRDRGGYGDRDRDRGGRYGGGGGRYDDDRRGGSGYRDGGRDDPWRRDRDSGPRGLSSGDSSTPKERPKLNLMPRSAPRGEEKKESGGGGSSSSIFGAARPVDTASREKEIENKLISKDPPIRRETGGSGGGNIFGAARPVDTAARERQIEEKLRKLDTGATKDEPRRFERRDDQRDDQREDRRDYRRDDRQDNHRNDRQGDHRDSRMDRRPPPDDHVGNDDVDHPSTRGRSNENHAMPPRHGKLAKVDEPIIDTTNKFAGLDLETED